uniref:Tetratricopeptide repeat domain 14 n=1 Tax=Loxodonta africana TaxID=9785 RepID=G3TB97_LOXAF
MDRDLLRQSLNCHGPSLLSLLRSEQQDNPHFRSLLGSAAEPARGPASQQLQGRKEKRAENFEIQKFISKKADLLFALSWKSDAPAVSEVNEDSEDQYAVMPPLEQFMEIPSVDRRELFFRDIERGDIVIGRISSIREFGFFMVLICLGSGIMRDISHLEITVTLGPLRDVPSHSNHGDPLSYYQTGDIIRAGIKDIDRYHEKLAVSLYSSSLPPHLSGVKLGVISSEELPLYYRRSVELNSNSLESYDNIMQSSLGFVNPGVVEYLLGKLGIDDSNPPSLMRGLQSKNFSEDDYALALRKKQSASWALKCVKIGVDYFKVGRHVDAMNEYNKALEIDKQNVEALVARGALYATKGSLNKAIEDFELALENCPTHRNARKYLCQTLVERGGQLEEEEKFLNAESYYKKALALDETFKDAEDALKLHKYMQKSLELREKQAEKEEKQKTKKIETSAEKLRKLLKEEKRLKKKRRKSTSSSSSISSADESVSSSSSSSSSHKRHKKRKRNHSESSRSSKRHPSKAPSSQMDQNRQDEYHPPPVSTSASFLNQKHEVEKLLEKQDRLPYQKIQVKEKNKYSVSSSSVEILDDFGGRSEDPRDFYNSYKTQASSSKTGKPYKSERHFSNRRDSTDSFCRNSEDKIKNYGSRRSDRDLEGRKEHSRRWESGSGRCSTSPSSSDYSWKSLERYKRCTYSGSHDFSKHEQRYQSNTNQGQYEREDNYGEDIKTQVPKEDGLNSKEQSESRVKKNLPNLLNIFNQIAEFEKEKGNKPKN